MEEKQMNLFVVIGKISNLEKGINYDTLYIVLVNAYFNGDLSQPMNFLLPIKVNKLIFKDELKLIKRNLNVSIKGRLEVANKTNTLYLVCEKLSLL